MANIYEIITSITEFKGKSAIVEIIKDKADLPNVILGVRIVNNMSRSAVLDWTIPKLNKKVS